MYTTIRLRLRKEQKEIKVDRYERGRRVASSGWQSADGFAKVKAAVDAIRPSQGS